MKILDLLFQEETEQEEYNEMERDFITYIEPLKRQLEIINSDLILGKITKEQEKELCKPILARIEAYERKYTLVK